jgi:hypothetical protein
MDIIPCHICGNDCKNWGAEYINFCRDCANLVEEIDHGYTGHNNSDPRIGNGHIPSPIWAAAIEKALLTLQSNVPGNI